MEYQSREDADRAVKQLDGKDLRGRTVRVVADNDVRLPWFFFCSLLILPSSVVPITTVGRNVVMTVTVVTIVIGIVRTALPTGVNARAPLQPVVRLMSADQGLLRAGNLKTAARLDMKGGRIVAPRNPILVRPVMNAVVKKGSGMKRMTDLTTVLPGTLMAMRATGKTNTRVA